jgi:dATP pyrophosphohydrolase
VKIPESVLVVVYTRQARVLLLERADHPGFWQSVTGSREPADPDLRATSLRELREETGLESEDGRLEDWDLTHRYPIYPHWRSRYAPGVTHNTEHVFGFELDGERSIVLDPAEHTRSCWLDWRDAAERCFSWTNVAAIRAVPERLAARGRA